MRLKSAIFLNLAMLFAFSCNNVSSQKEESNPIADLLALQVASSATRPISTTSSTGSTSTTETSTSGSSTSSSSSAASLRITPTTGHVIAGQNLSVTVSGLGSSSVTDSIYFSTNEIISTLDTLVVSSVTISSSSQTVSIPVPSSLSSRQAYYIGFLRGPDANTSSRVIVLPSTSAVANYTFNSVVAGETLNSTTTHRYYSVNLTNGQNFVMSSYNVAGGLDTILNVLTVNGNLTDRDANATNNFERAGVTVSTTGPALIEVRRFGTTSGTYRFFAANSNILSGTVATGGGSCTGGATAAFTNRCVDYDSAYTSAPTSDANCASIQGAGSTFSAGTCTTNNRIARCHANPLGNNGRITVNYYSTNDTTTSANTACNGDILTTP